MFGKPDGEETTAHPVGGIGIFSTLNLTLSFNTRMNSFTTSIEGGISLSVEMELQTLGIVVWMLLEVNRWFF